MESIDKMKKMNAGVHKDCILLMTPSIVLVVMDMYTVYVYVYINKKINTLPKVLRQFNRLSNRLNRWV